MEEDDDLSELGDDAATVARGIEIAAAFEECRAEILRRSEAMVKAQQHSPLRR